MGDEHISELHERINGLEARVKELEATNTELAESAMVQISRFERAVGEFQKAAQEHLDLRSEMSGRSDLRFCVCDAEKCRCNPGGKE